MVWLLEELKVPYSIELYHRENMLAPKSLRKIHPLGKSPLVTIKPVGASEPFVLAESGYITQYLCDHFAPAGNPALVPAKWQPGKEGQVGGETESYRRFQYLLHYGEGTLMPIVVVSLILNILGSDRIPFLVRPVSGFVASKIQNAFVFPEAKKNFALLDGMLQSAPGGPDGYLCGDTLTAADILLSFPLIAAKSRFAGIGAWEGGSIDKAFPRVWAYLEKLENSPGYKASVEKIKELDNGKFVAIAG